MLVKAMEKSSLVRMPGSPFYLVLKSSKEMVMSGKQE
jgi:hypothetical protein